MLNNKSVKKALKRLFKPAKHIWSCLIYGGHKLKCPICSKGASHFLTYGIVPRSDARCPFCGALERHRLFWLFVERCTKFSSDPPSKALHVAPEPILQRKLKHLIGEGYMTADLLEQDVDLQMDITDIQFPDGFFDFIYCSHVLEHVPDDKKAMREFRRVLAENGFAVLLVPITAETTIEDPSITDPQERLRLFGQADHVRRYGPDYLARLQEAGFTVQVLEREHFLSPFEIETMAITAAAGELYVCRKSSGISGPLN
jgi:SAM-dependent methyltransferase